MKRIIRGWLAGGLVAAVGLSLLSCSSRRSTIPGLGIPLVVDFATLTGDLTVGAEVGAISGQVVSSRGGPIPSAQVRVSLPVSIEQAGVSSFTVVTDGSGMFQVGNMPRGYYDLKLSHNDYEEVTVQVPVEAGVITARSFSLRPLHDTGGGTPTPGGDGTGGRTPGLEQPAGPDVVGQYAVVARLEFSQGPEGSVPQPLAKADVKLGPAVVSNATVAINGRSLLYDGAHSDYRAVDAFEFTPDGYYTLEVNGGEVRISARAPSRFANLTTPSAGAMLSGQSIEVSWQPTGAESYSLIGIPLTGSLDARADDGSALFSLDAGDLQGLDMLRVTTTVTRTLTAATEGQEDVTFTLATHLGVDVN